MAIFGNQSSDINASFNVSNNIKDLSANLALRDKAMFDMAQKFSDTNEEMAQLRATAGQIISQYGVDEKGRPSDSAPKYIHDIYKGIQKEGGIEGLPKSSLMQAIKGYETGFQIDSQRQKIEQNQQSLELNRYNLETARLQAEQQKRIIKASEEASNLEVDKKRKIPSLVADVPEFDRNPKTAIKSPEYTNLDLGSYKLTSDTPMGGESEYTKGRYLAGPPLNAATAERDALLNKERKTSLAKDVLDKSVTLAKEIKTIEERIKKVQSPISDRLVDYNQQHHSARNPVTGIFDSRLVVKRGPQILEDQAEEKLLFANLDAAKKNLADNEKLLLGSINDTASSMYIYGEAKPLVIPKPTTVGIKEQDVEVDKTEDEIIKEEYGVLLLCLARAIGREKRNRQAVANRSSQDFRKVDAWRRVPSV